MQGATPPAVPLVTKLSHAALVGGDGIGGGGDGTADHDVIGADALGLGGGHDALLVAHVAVGEADAGGDGEEALAAEYWEKLKKLMEMPV